MNISIVKIVHLQQKFREFLCPRFTYDTKCVKQQHFIIYEVVLEVHKL